MVKKIFLFSALFLLSVSLSAFSSEGRINQVTLFTNQAQIEKNVKTSVNKGLNKIYIDVEAFTLDSDSISVKVFGDGQVYSVQHKKVYLKTEPQQNIQDLLDKIEKLKDQKEVLKKESDILVKKEKFINSLIDFSKTQIPLEIKTKFPSPQDLEKTLNFLDSNLTAIVKEQQEINNQEKDLKKEIALLQRKLNAIQAYRRQMKNVIEVVFNSEKKQDIGIIATYVVANASWQPLYKVAVDLDLKDINLTMFSKIKQKTGEDWKDIQLTLSNVIPLKGLRLPSPRSWFLSIRKPQPPRQRKLLYSKSESLYRDSTLAGAIGDDLAEEKKQEADFIQARSKKLPISFEYELPQKLTIKSKDKDTLLPVFSKILKGDFYYWAVPRINKLTYLVGKIKPDSQLLAGALNVYFGGRFMGKTYLEEKKAGEEFLLNLGATRQIKVSREKILDKKDETFFGNIKRNTIIRNLSFKITVENLKDKTAKIKILDSIPVAKTDKIEVKNVQITPEPTEKNYQDKEGLYLWDLSVKPQSKKEITIDFTITYPEDKPIVGL